MSNSKLRKLLLEGGDPDEILKVAESVVARGGRINPTGRDLPPGNVAFLSRTGRIEQKARGSAFALERAGSGIALETPRDVERAIRGPTDEPAAPEPEKAEKRPESEPETGVEDEDVAEVGAPDPGPLNRLKLATLVEEIDDAEVLAEMLRMEQDGKDRKHAVQAIRERMEKLSKE